MLVCKCRMLISKITKTTDPHGSMDSVEAAALFLTNWVFRQDTSNFGVGVIAYKVNGKMGLDT